MKRIGDEDLQNAVAVTSIAEILKAKVTLSFRELVAESLLELGARSTHERVEPITATQIFIRFNSASRIAQHQIARVCRAKENADGGRKNGENGKKNGV